MSRNQLSWKNSQIFHERGSHFQLSKSANVSLMHYFWHLKMPGFKKPSVKLGSMTVDVNFIIDFSRLRILYRPTNHL